MKINNNSNISTNFCASLKLQNLYKTFMDPKTLENLEKKASKIGFENDVIEIKYTNFKHDVTDYYSGQDNCYMILGDKYTSTFKAKFISGGKTFEKVKEGIVADNIPELCETENKLANDYLDNLYNKFGGV